MEYCKEARNAAVMYPDRVKNRGIVRDPCARMELLASPEPSKSLSAESLRDLRFNQRSRKLIPPHSRAVEDPPESRAGTLLALDDIYEAVSKASDSHS